MCPKTRYTKQSRCDQSSIPASFPSHGSKNSPPGLPRISSREGPPPTNTQTPPATVGDTPRTPFQVSTPSLRGPRNPSPPQGYGSLPAKARLCCHAYPFPPLPVFVPSPDPLRPQSSHAQASLTYQVASPHDGADSSSQGGSGRLRKDWEETKRNSSALTSPDRAPEATGCHFHCPIWNPLPGGRSITAPASRDHDVQHCPSRCADVT